MAITTEEKYILDNLAGPVAGKVKLGTLIENAETSTDGTDRSHVIVAAGKHTTTGGAAAEDVTLAGVLATDVVMATLDTEGATPKTLVSAKAAAGKITVTFSGDPSTDHVVQYAILRAAS